MNYIVPHVCVLVVDKNSAAARWPERFNLEVDGYDGDYTIVDRDFSGNTDSIDYVPDLFVAIMDGEVLAALFKANDWFLSSLGWSV